MNTETSVITRRRPWLAALLSFLMPGLGQLYCGATIKCFCISALMSGIGILTLLAIGRSHANDKLLVASLALGLLVYGFSILDAFATACRTRDDYKLKDYNRWQAYLLFCLAVSGGYLFAALYVRETLAEAFVVPSASMYPAIRPGDRLLAARNIYLDKNPAIGDVVIFRNPQKRSQIFIKRVVALEGDSVEIRDDELYVNGTKLQRQAAPAPAFIVPELKESATYFYELNQDARYEICLSGYHDPNLRNCPKTVVPKYHCFVMGDNRDDSNDSRNFGAIPIVGIIGKASFIYLPSSDWSRFGSMP